MAPHMQNKLVSLLYESWADLDLATGGLTPALATERADGGSCIAWAVAHVTQMLDSFVVVRFLGLPRHPVISNPAFRTGGSGEALDWPLVAASVREVREAAKRLLDSATEADLRRTVPYDGSIEYLRPTGLPLDYAVLRTAAHHFMHAGEIETVRSRLGCPIEGGRPWGLSLL